MSLLRSNHPSSNPLADWKNNDLLTTPETRRLVAEPYPRAFQILDWPEFRSTFLEHDEPAKKAKQGFDDHGLWSAVLSTLGASLLALAPLVPPRVPQHMVILLGCALVAVGGLMGLWHLLGHGGRTQWLINRLWAERLRQFYFQYIINNLGAAVAAMGDDRQLAGYKVARAGALALFITDLRQNLAARTPAGGVAWISTDHEDARMWGRGDWRTSRVSRGTVMCADHRELFECLSRGRIGIQEYYAQLNLKRDAAGQGTMARRLLTFGNITTFVFVASLTLASVSIILDWPTYSADILIAVSGVAAAWGLCFRLVDQGMGYSLDAERYELYAEQMAHIRSRFDAAEDDVAEKISALRQLETYTYREMRQFLRTHLKSRFLG